MMLCGQPFCYICMHTCDAYICMGGTASFQDSDKVVGGVICVCVCFSTQ